MPDTQSFGPTAISSHTWNGDRTQIALSSNNNEVDVYKVGGAKWEKLHTLGEHSQKVSGIDWAPKSNRIVTCSADRNAYVWSPQEDGSWKATMVILRINRAATCVKWSPQENKFAVGSGARAISVCYFESDNDWWVSKHIKKPLRSTVTCLDWHPNNILLSAGSSDFKARVFSGYIKEVESKPSETSWGSKMPFGNMLAEFTNGGGGWVHDISFSANGNRLVWVGHDCSISIVDSTTGSNMATIKTEFLPFVTCTWITQNSIVAAGYDCQPMLFEYNGSSVTFMNKLDSTGGQQQSGKISAMKMFQARDTKAQDADNGTTLHTTHQNTILQMSVHSGGKDSCTKFTTTGVDGLLANWDIKSLESAIAGLRIK